MSKRKRDFWIETSDKTFLYYRVRALSQSEALRKFARDEAEYVGCTDDGRERIKRVLKTPPYIGWSK